MVGFFRNFEDLTDINAVWVANLIPVGIKDRLIADSTAVGFA